MSENLNENEEKIKRLAKDVMRLAANKVVVNFRFFDSAVNLMNLVEYPGTVSTDGKNMFYNPVFVLKAYKVSQAFPIRYYLHTIAHCIFRHSIIGITADARLWDLACDIAAEAIVNELCEESAYIPAQSLQEVVIDELQKKIKFVTAEKIYRHLLDGNVSESVMSRWEELFRIDDHTIWHIYEATGGGGAGESDNVTGGGSARKSDNVTGGGDAGESDNGQKGKNKSDNGSSGNSSGDNESRDNSLDNFRGTGMSKSQLEKEWKDISERLQTDLETFSKQKGDKAGNLVQNLTEINREKYDYTAFLKKFAVMGEAMKINDDEFDYIFYTYGMKLYDKMPLIEPLEYKDVKRIKEFVIAIDTSGSVSGELVQKFIQKTYNILKQSESFFTKINVHIVQCDAEIQEDAKITSQEEFDRYIETMKLKGFGGTDFRPVFNYVDKLIKDKEFTNLKGLIYFTDGYGDFPAHQPPYNTAFVFVEDEYEIPEVPVWAIKLILQSEEI